MRKPLLCLGCSLVGLVFLSGLSACSNNKADPGTVATGGSGGQSGQDCKAGSPGSNYVLIDDMETTSHGPIQFSAGIAAPLSPGYWYNSGASYRADAGVDMSNPPQGSFMFSALPAPMTTLSCKSAHAARQHCTLSGLYDTCGVGFEFAQQPAPDAGPPPANDPNGGLKETVPFDISHYKAITFWGMTTTPDPAVGSMQVKVSFPDTDTDPRGQICNGGGLNTSRCYNSYAALLNFTTTWQQFTVKLEAGTAGMPPEGGIAIDPSWGYQQAMWLPTKVYGINWQAQKNTEPDAGPPLTTEIWIDDVYFIQ
jgi:hypothetical protein